MKKWIERTFDELIAAGVLSIGDGYRAKNAELGGDGPIFLRAGHVSDSHIDFSGVERFRAELEPKLEDKMSQIDDVIITTKGNSTGRTSFVTEHMPQFVYSPHLSRWRSIDNDTLCPTFLRYWARGREFVVQLNGMKASTDMAPYLSLRDQRMLRITLPPKQEQETIAEILCSLDDKIELNRRMNRTLEQMAAAIFKAWFVDFEPVKAKADGAKSFPSMPQKVFDALPTEFTNSPLGPIPKGWDVRAIADLARYVNGRAFTKHANGQGRMIIRIAELNSGPGGSTKYGEMDVDEENTAYPDDILFPWSGSLGVFRWHRAEAIINQHIFKVIPEGHPKWFVYFALLDALPFFRSVAAGKATTMGHIQRHHLSDAKLAVAPDDLVEAAGAVVQPLYSLIHANETQSATLAKIRDALLPKLLSREILVCEAERIAEEVA